MSVLELGRNYFGITDYILLAFTLAFSLLIGIYYGYSGKQTNEELLVGGRKMHIFPMAASVMVTYLSAVTILGFPGEVFAHGAQVFLYPVISSVGMIISSVTLIPYFYPMKLTSINDYLEKRYESVWVRWMAASIFIIQQLIFQGMVLYMPSIALEAFLGFPLWLSILVIGASATIYTNLGGIKAVVWTDTFQFFMMIGGMGIICWRGISASGGFTTSVKLAYDRKRLDVFDFNFDLFQRHNFWNFLVGYGFHAIMQPGVHQMQVQRYSAMPSRRKASSAIAGAAPLKIMLMTACLLTGVAIFAFYANCDPIATGEVQKLDEVVTYFIVQELNYIPGIMGIFTSCILSAVLSTISSSLNSLAAVTWEDFLSRLPYFQKMSPRAQANVTRSAGLIYGLIFMCSAVAAQHMGSLYAATFAIIGGTAGALYGLFLMSLFVPFANAIGAVVGSFVGLISIMVVVMGSFINKSNYKNKSSLPMSTEGCPDSMNLTMAFTTTTPVPLDPTESDGISFDEWPWKLFTLSYLLYPMLATIITMIIGISVSLLARAFSRTYGKWKPRAEMVHPIIRNCFANYLIKKRSDSTIDSDFYSKSTMKSGIFMKPL